MNSFFSCLRRHFFIGLILVYWSFCLYLMTVSVLMPRLKEGTIGPVLIIVEWSISLLVLFCLARTYLSDPGYVTPDSFKRYMSVFRKVDQPPTEFCDKCKMSRPLRAHHCSRCGRCILRMDHHCIWVNNCIGSGNQWIFMLLLFYSILMACSCSYTIRLHHYILPPCPPQFCPPTLWYHASWVLIVDWMLVFVIGIPMGILLLVQNLNALSDKTTMEIIKGWTPADWAITRSSLGTTRCQNYERVCGFNNPFFWLLPCRHKQDVLIDDEIEKMSAYRV